MDESDLRMDEHEANNNLRKSKRDNIQEFVDLFVSETEKTFQYEDTLPRLPVPELRATLDKYLDSVRPIATAAEYAQTEATVRDFETGVGQSLQQLLTEKGKLERNWLHDWWLNAAYLSTRKPLIPFGNMNGLNPEISFWPPENGTATERVALLLHYMLLGWKAMRDETLKPNKHKGVPLAMDQLKNYFNTVRVPGEVRDQLVSGFKTSSEGEAAPTTVVVFCRGYCFAIEPVDRNLEEPYTAPEICEQLQIIQQWCLRQETPGEAVAALTSTDRTLWAKNRIHLKALHPENAENVTIIETALLSVVLDESAPTNRVEQFRDTMFGDPSNRWGDKSSQWIIFENGLLSASSEHTAYDGSILFFITWYLLLATEASKGKYIGSKEMRPLVPMPKRLQFHMDQNLTTEIASAKLAFAETSKTIQISYLAFEDYGKTFITEKGVHPEAYIQLVLQLAYYRLHAKPGTCYASALTRKYFRGRTETARACTVEAIEFCKALTDAPENVHLLKETLYKATAKFQQLLNEAMDGHGCDRHLLGLYLTALENAIPVPALFCDPLYTKSGGNGNFVLSTSTSGYWATSGGLPPMREDGYAIFYGLGKASLHLGITGYRTCPETDTDLMKGMITESLRDIQRILSDN